MLFHKILVKFCWKNLFQLLVWIRVEGKRKLWKMAPFYLHILENTVKWGKIKYRGLKLLIPIPIKVDKYLMTVFFHPENAFLLKAETCICENCRCRKCFCASVFSQENKSSKTYNKIENKGQAFMKKIHQKISTI